jgi:hypothetical protein
MVITKKLARACRITANNDIEEMSWNEPRLEDHL